MRSFTLLAFVACFSYTSADRIDDTARKEMARLHAPGFVVGILRKGKLVDTRTYGKASIELDVPVRKEDVFEIGSCTKQFTAFATMRLIEDGKLSLDDPVSKWIPESPQTWKPVLLSNLLYQTSGLKDYALVPGIGLLDEYDRAKWMSEMTKLPLDFDPGVAWAYSNTNYALLGWIIEKASGKPYAEFVTEQVLKPAGLTHTRIAGGLDIVPHKAQGYLMNEGTLVRTPPFGTSIQADGALVSNVADMAKWLAFLRDRKILRPASYDMLWSPAKLNSGRTRPYGMGFFLTTPGGPRFVGHHGASPGFGAGLAVYPEKDLGVVVLFNVYPGNGDGVARAVAETIDPSLRPLVAKTATDPDAARTTRIREALTKYAKGEADANYLMPEVLAPMKTQRMATGGGFRPLREMKALLFASAAPQGPDTLLTYRVVTADDKSYTAMVLWTSEGKLAQLILRPDPS